MQKPQLPIVSIVGRPNVGKSSLFNRLLRRRAAIVHDQSGVTRDRNYQSFSWNKRKFVMVDTGGMVPASKQTMESLVREQVEQVIHEAALVLFVVDAMAGPTDLDLLIAGILKKGWAQKTVLVANKAESDDALLGLDEFYGLGLGEPYPVSALHGQNTADLLDLIVDRLKGWEPYADQVGPCISIAVLGRPNAGKSSLINAFCKHQRMIVDDKPGTTRDAVDVYLTFDNVYYTLIDTAGMRKKARVRDDVEYFSNLRAASSIDRCDVAIVLVDTSRELEEQDARIVGLVVQHGKGLVIGLNKWDLVEKDHRTFDELSRRINESYPELKHIPRISISALTGLRIPNLLELAKSVYDRSGTMVDKGEFREFITNIVNRSPPPAKAKQPIRIYSMIQEDVFPPTFVGRSNYPKYINATYTRFIRNRILAHYPFSGCSVRIKWKGPKKHDDA